VVLVTLVVSLAFTGPGLGNTANTTDELPADLLEALRFCGLVDETHPEDTARRLEAVRVAIRGGAKPSLLTSLLTRAYEKEFEPSTIDEILQRARRLADQELPINLVLSRVLQGMAKNVEFSRILVVADTLGADLLEAARIIGELHPIDQEAPSRSERHALIGHAASALATGVPSEELRQSLDLVVHSNVWMSEARGPVLAMSSIVSGGLKPERAFQIVETAWTHGYKGEVLERLGQVVRASCQSSEPITERDVDVLLDHLRNDSQHDEIVRRLEEVDGFRETSFLDLLQLHTISSWRAVPIDDPPEELPGDIDPPR
jgi:hypothetical protein